MTCVHFQIDEVRKIIQAWITGEFLAVMSKELKQEINTGGLHSPQPLDEIIFLDENDHFLLELAVTRQADFIVTGDKNLLKSKRVMGVEILNPNQLCQKLKIK